MPKRLLTPREEATNDVLKPLCEYWGSHVFPKVRVADVLPIDNSGISDLLFRFALQSHFDFIVTGDDILPLFAVEFDGITHLAAEQQQRDTKKNLLCKQFEFPLLRINSRYLEGKYRGLTLLGWFIHSWFATRSLVEAQEAGHIPADEPIDATFLYSIPGESRKFPLWLTREIQGKVRKLAESGICLDRGISCVVGEDEEQNSHAIAYVNLGHGKAVWTQTAMRSQLFPVDFHAVLEDIAVSEAYERLCAVMSGTEQPTPGPELDQEIDRFRKRYKLCSASISGPRA
jgi:Protein of unknown function (DUF2726)